MNELLERYMQIVFRKCQDAKVEIGSERTKGILEYGTRIDIKSGTEGPSYDPYHWDEITVERRGIRVTLHLGLAVWMDVENNHVPEPVRWGNQLNVKEEDILRAFTGITDLTPGTAFTYFWRKRSRCPFCRSKKVGALGGGYVGETMYGCLDCKAVLWDDFCMSMIE